MKVWSFVDGKWAGQAIGTHNGWVRDVSWASNIGLPYETLASCSQDGDVVIWRENRQGKWEEIERKNENNVVWRVSWSTTGNILAVTSGDNKVTLYTESLNEEGKWKAISQMDESGALAFSAADQMS